MQLGHTIALLREKKGISQKKLASDLDVSPGAVGQWETNSRIPKLDKFVEIADYFSISADFLLQNDRKVTQEDFIHEIDKIIPKKQNISLSHSEEQANVIRETFLKLSKSNQYILMGKAMELLKEEKQTPGQNSQGKRA
jgi:transcriptional regulator with XRE-family HTH domain